MYLSIGSGSFAVSGVAAVGFAFLPGMNVWAALTIWVVLGVVIMGVTQVLFMVGRKAYRRERLARRRAPLMRR